MIGISTWQSWGNPIIAPFDKYSVQVHHFKWDLKCINRLKSVENYKINSTKEWDGTIRSQSSYMYDELCKCNFKVDVNEPDYMFEFNQNNPDYGNFKLWYRLIRKIVLA